MDSPVHENIHRVHRRERAGGLSDGEEVKKETP